MLGRPMIGEHVFEAFVVCVQSHQKFSNVGPGLNAMTLCAGQDRVQHGRSRTRSLAPEK
jgi:hypothetical protein